MAALGPRRVHMKALFGLVGIILVVLAILLLDVHKRLPTV
jgi:hypothetical protein